MLFAGDERGRGPGGRARSRADQRTGPPRRQRADAGAGRGPPPINARLRFL